MENRLPDGAANPYLTQAIILAAGLDGIENKTGTDYILKYKWYIIVRERFALCTKKLIRNNLSVSVTS